MYCSNCGKKLSAGTKTCLYCGRCENDDDSSVRQTNIENKLARKWSWGGFTLGWIYLAGMGGGWLTVLFLILNLIPIINVVGMIYLGIKGRKIASERRKWKSTDQYQAVQRQWDIWGIVIFIIAILIGVFSAI